MRKTAAALLSSVLLAACGGAAAPSVTPSAPPGSAPASVAAATSAKPAASASTPASAAAKPAASGAASASAAAGNPIKIGLITDLTGTTAEVGKNGVDGFSLYVDSIGNINGRKLEVLPADDQIKPDVGVTKAKQLAESDHVSIIAGVLNAAVCYALADWDKGGGQTPLAITAGCNGQNLTTDPRFQSPYLVRLTLVPMAIAEPMADWSYSNGIRKVVLITPDNAGGIEAADTYSAAFVKRGGTIVQEMHPAFGTADFGPFLAKLDTTADAIYTFLPGADGLRFLDQYQNYAAQHKLKILDLFGVMTEGNNLVQQKDKAEGIISGTYANLASNTEQFQALGKALQAKYPGRVLSSDIVQSYAGAQVILAAMKKVNGNVESKQQFMDALYATDLETVKGPVKLDKSHDVVQNTYILQIVKGQNGAMDHKLLQTYPLQTQTGTFTADQIAKLKSGTNKDKWVGMTQAKLGQTIGS
ncbi:MAG: ABC transporter substrate-binding protein [Chloroflexota bacterium]